MKFVKGVLLWALLFSTVVSVCFVSALGSKFYHEHGTKYMKLYEDTVIYVNKIESEKNELIAEIKHEKNELSGVVLDSSDTLIREHERQLIYGEIVLSQKAWEKQAEAMLTAYQFERKQRYELQVEMDRLEREVFHFMKILKRIDPEAFKEVQDNAPDTSIPNKFFKTGPTPAER